MLDVVAINRVSIPLGRSLRQLNQQMHCAALGYTWAVRWDVRSGLAFGVAMLLFGACEDAGGGVAGRAGTVTSQASSSTTGDDEPSNHHDDGYDGVAAPLPTRGPATSWGTVLRGLVAVERTSSAPELTRAKEALQKAGYRVYPGATDINCDQGAREALRLTPSVDYFVEAVYFLTRQEAQQFVDAFEPGVVGTAFVTVYCRD